MRHAPKQKPKVYNVTFGHMVVFCTHTIWGADVDGFVLYQHIVLVFEDEGTFQIFLVIFTSHETTVDRVWAYFGKSL
jgi:hypothetical protein